jgi:hypothetical protein
MLETRHSECSKAATQNALVRHERPGRARPSADGRVARSKDRNKTESGQPPRGGFGAQEPQESDAAQRSFVWAGNDPFRTFARRPRSSRRSRRATGLQRAHRRHPGRHGRADREPGDVQQRAVLRLLVRYGVRAEYHLRMARLLRRRLPRLWRVGAFVPIAGPPEAILGSPA